MIQHGLQKEPSNLCKSLLEQKPHLIVFLTFFCHKYFTSWHSVADRQLSPQCHSQLIPNCTRNGWNSLHAIKGENQEHTTCVANQPSAICSCWKLFTNILRSRCRINLKIILRFGKFYLFPFYRWGSETERLRLTLPRICKCQQPRKTARTGL